MVYFLTEVTENDLLNVTANNSETLPKNSAALESAIPVTEGALPNNNGEQGTEENLRKSRQRRGGRKAPKNLNRSRRKQKKTRWQPISFLGLWQLQPLAAAIISR